LHPAPSTCQLWTARGCYDQLRSRSVGRRRDQVNTV
jgi:hypothetical protein